MNTFREYANYYNLIYQDKDYKAESNFLESIFSKYSNKPIKTILDLGCGTGGHSLILAEKGYKITGVDISEEMLEIGKKKAGERKLNMEFIQGDIRNIELNHKFDAVISMFAVMSYQTTNEDLISAFKTASKHLKKNGLFIFDFWFGPAVLIQRPNARMKIIHQSGEQIIRFASPTLDIMTQTVQVNYKLLRIKDGHILNEVNESHMMRFLFPKEIEYYLSGAGFNFIELCPFMKIGKVPSTEDWNISVVAVKYRLKNLNK